ncbi:MAG: CBS domain-containing protein [Thiohalobacteraceae bacterium]|nr:CBS domain-containing protein [Gammaproteobacteria bacterium]
MSTVRQVLEGKGFEVATVTPDVSVYDAIAVMVEKNIGSLVVLDGNHIVGMLSERDYVRKVALKGRMSKQTQVREIMTVQVPYASPDQTVEECMAVLTDQRVRHLPVMENGRLIGIISIGDLIKAIIDEHKFIVNQLIHYITG